MQSEVADGAVALAVRGVADPQAQYDAVAGISDEQPPSLIGCDGHAQRALAGCGNMRSGEHEPVGAGLSTTAAEARLSFQAVSSTSTFPGPGTRTEKVIVPSGSVLIFETVNLLLGGGGLSFRSRTNTSVRGSCRRAPGSTRPTEKAT